MDFGGQNSGEILDCGTVEKAENEVESGLFAAESQALETAGLVAQWLERWTHNPLVVGPNPTEPSNITACHI